MAEDRGVKMFGRRAVWSYFNETMADCGSEDAWE